MKRPFPGWRGRGVRRPRSGYTIALLALTLALAGVLAYHAQDAARSHRAAAESALRDYTAFAAWDYAARITSILDYQLYARGLKAYAMLAVSPQDAATLPPDTILARAAEKADAYELDIADLYFAVDLATDAVAIAGPDPGPAVRRWLADAVGPIPAPDWPATCRNVPYHALIGGPAGEDHLVAYEVRSTETGTRAVAYGIVARPERITPMLRYAYAVKPLLPETLIRGTPNDSLLSVAVRTAGGRELFASRPRYSAPMTVEQTLDPCFGALRATVTLRPETAGMLIIGGLPRSRMPLLIGLMVLTTGLVGAAVVQLRREHELARLRTEFVSSVSHELRTPLAHIRMFGETLLLGRVRSEEERRRSLEIVDQEARRLTHLVENVLLFSRAERQMMRVDPRPLRLAPVVDEVIETVAPLAGARDVRIEPAVDASVAASVDGDAVRQVLLNFVDNALKYGPRGQTVRLALERVDGHARLSVEDEGPGVPDEERHRIWNAYQRAGRDRDSAVAGAGIGLDVVRRLVERHGGRVGIETAAGGGARFFADFPGAWRWDDEAAAESFDATGATAGAEGVGSTETMGAREPGDRTGTRRGDRRATGGDA